MLKCYSNGVAKNSFYGNYSLKRLLQALKSYCFTITSPMFKENDERINYEACPIFLTTSRKVVVIKTYFWI